MMGESAETLIEILSESVKRYGVIPLTNQHLLNILKMAVRTEQELDHMSDLEGSRGL